MYIKLSDNSCVRWLAEDAAFPHSDTALGAESAWNGLLAAGGNLTPNRLLMAYQQGIFPWSEAHYPPLWWCPDPRMVLYPQHFKLSKSLGKKIRILLSDYDIAINTNFAETIEACAKKRERTWITTEMQQAYIKLHNQGLAHSFELRQHGILYAALYGVCLGDVFFGESMMTHITDGSKVLVWALCQYAIQNRISLIDCQVESAHLASLGACTISRQHFLEHLHVSVHKQQKRSWDLSALDLLPRHKPPTAPSKSCSTM